jgi:thiamine biosynthesis lipoprotein
MSALQWRDWSCTVRLVLADGRPTAAAPADDVAAAATGLVQNLMADVARSASRFRPDSDVELVNARAGVLVPVRPLTLRLVQVALDAAERTDGACDPTVGAHLLAAGYDADIDEVRARAGARLPAATQVAADWTGVRLDRTLGRVGVRSGQRLDLGATAKAWTADAAAERLHASLGLAVLVALGGDVAVAGVGEWPVLVSELEDEPGEVVRLASGGLATSSVRGRRWATAAGARHHVIDPATGQPTTGTIRSASVRAETCVEANALSTAALVWGHDAPERLAGLPSRLVRHDGIVVTTGTWTLGVAA